MDEDAESSSAGLAKGAELVPLTSLLERVSDFLFDGEAASGS